MDDRELLELAANAIGFTIDYWHSNGNPMIYFGETPMAWNPLYDDGDALRLAVELGILIDCDNNSKTTEGILEWANEDGSFKRFEEHHGDNPYAATRRAIVRAAAELGRI